jgi:LuxR family maltose regulon positive regulatory protein
VHVRCWRSAPVATGAACGNWTCTFVSDTEAGSAYSGVRAQADDVIRLLGTDLDGPDIARRLVVSLNTVRTHTKNIYAKLGVNNRRAAVRRAQELDLLSPTLDR